MGEETSRFRTEQLINDLINQLTEVKRGLEALKVYQERATVSITEIKTHMEYTTKAVDKLEKIASDQANRVTRIEERMVDGVRERIAKNETKLKKVAELDELITRTSRDLNSTIHELLGAGQDLDNRLVMIESSEKKAEKISSNAIAIVGAVCGIAGTIAAVVALFQ